MSKRVTKLVFLGVALLLALGTVVSIIFSKANAMADYSAHAALTAEICDRLSSIPAGQRFPVSLSELQLTYPDGGNSSLLTRFTYNSVGTGCTVTTSLRGEKLRIHIRDLIGWFRLPVPGHGHSCWFDLAGLFNLPSRGSWPFHT